MASRDAEQNLRVAAYFIWEREGRLEGRAMEHWEAAAQIAARQGRDDDHLADTEAVLDGDPRANYPAVLTKDVPGG